MNLLPKGAGNVGVKTRTPVQDLTVNGRMYLENGVIQRGGTKIISTSDLGLYSQVGQQWIRIVTSDAPIAFYTDGGIGSTRRMIVRQDGVLIGTTDLRSDQQNSMSGGTVADRFYVQDALVFREPNLNMWFKIRQSYGHLGYSDVGAEPDGGPSSDVRLKTALRPIGDALDKVLRLRGLRYRWGETGLDHFTKDIPSTVCAGPGGTAEDDRQLWDDERQRTHAVLAGDRIGLVAQDVEPVVPEVVTEDRDGYKHIRYQHLTALLVEAIKEQHALVKAMATRLAAVEQATAAD